MATVPGRRGRHRDAQRGADLAGAPTVPEAPGIGRRRHDDALQG
jgi:hypothetical protein